MIIKEVVIKQIKMALNMRMPKRVNVNLHKMATFIVGKLSLKDKQNQNAASIQMLTQTMTFLL